MKGVSTAHETAQNPNLATEIVWICVPCENYVRVDDKRMLRGRKICFDFDNAGLGFGIWGVGVQ